MTNQEIFDKVWNHFVVERKPRSILMDNALRQVCKYRDGRGNACAVGLFIPDAVYAPRLEILPLTALHRGCYLPNVSQDSLPLFCALQGVHDDWRTAMLSLHIDPAALQAVARDFDLCVPSDV